MDFKGYKIEPKALFQTPTFLLRFVCLLFAIIILACIDRDGYYLGKCVFYTEGSACGMSLAVSSLGLFLCCGFMAVDAIFMSITPQSTKKYITMADVGISAFWTLLFFVTFCYMANHWQRAVLPEASLLVINLNNIRASIAFAFFSIISWAGLTYTSVLRYQQNAHYSSYNDEMSGVTSLEAEAGSRGPASFEGYIEPGMASGNYLPHNSEFVTGRRANDTDLLAG